MADCPWCGKPASAEDAYCRSCGAELPSGAPLSVLPAESLLVATFGPTTAWMGKTVHYEAERFVLEGHGPIEATAVRDYGRQGHLIWAYEGLREWVDELAARPEKQAAATSAPASDDMQEAHRGQSVTADPSPPLSEPVSGQGRPWVLPVVMLVLLALTALLATALQGGYLRNGFGIGFTICAVVLMGLLIWSLVRPGALRPYAPRSVASGGRSVATLLVASAVCLGLAVILWWVPHYDVVVPSDKRVILDSSPEFTVKVRNRGLFPGTFRAAYSVAGEDQSPVQLALSAGETKDVALPLAPNTSRAQHLLRLGSANMLVEAVLPATFRVHGLELSAPVAKVGQSIRVDATVENVGDLAGNFPGLLRANGSEVGSSPSTVGPGESASLSYVFSRRSVGRCHVQLGNAGKTIMVVHPIRPENGAVLRRKISGGPAQFTVKNPLPCDAMVVLSRTSSPLNPVLAVYVRPHDKAIMNGIPDGKYFVWDASGRDWNTYMGDFLTDPTHVRSRQALTFATWSSTRHWSQGYMNYWQTSRHWTNWTHWVWNASSKYSAAVSARRFPHL